MPSLGSKEKAHIYSTAYAIQEMPIQSAICLPKPDEQVKIVCKEFESN